MKKTLTPRRAVCGLLAALAAAAAVWLLCRWVGYDLQLRLGDKQQFEIVNDDYSRIIDVPDEGLVQTFPLKAGQSICGVRLNFSTHDALYKCGMVMVDLYDENGQLLGQGAGNFLNIFNDSFTAFAYGGSYTAEKDEVLTLHIYNEVAWDGPLGLWASEGTVPGMPLYAGDTAQDATLALQIMTGQRTGRPGWRRVWRRCWRRPPLPPCCSVSGVPRRCSIWQWWVLPAGWPLCRSRRR